MSAELGTLLTHAIGSADTSTSWCVHHRTLSNSCHPISSLLCVFIQGIIVIIGGDGEGKNNFLPTYHDLFSRKQLIQVCDDSLIVYNPHNNAYYDYDSASGVLPLKNIYNGKTMIRIFHNSFKWSRTQGSMRMSYSMRWFHMFSYLPFQSAELRVAFP